MLDLDLLHVWRSRTVVEARMIVRGVLTCEVWEEMRRERPLEYIKYIQTHSIHISILPYIDITYIHTVCMYSVSLCVSPLSTHSNTHYHPHYLSPFWLSAGTCKTRRLPPALDNLILSKLYKPQSGLFVSTLWRSSDNMSGLDKALFNLKVRLMPYHGYRTCHYPTPTSPAVFPLPLLSFCFAENANG